MKQFSRVLSHEQHWGDKIYKLKRPFIKSKTTGTYIFQAVYNAQSTCLNLIKHFWFFQYRHLLHESGPIREVIYYLKNECLKQTDVGFQWGIPAKRIREIFKFEQRNTLRFGFSGATWSWFKPKWLCWRSNRTEKTGYPFRIPSIAKLYPFRIPSIAKLYPFHIPCLELCIPSNFC